MQLMAERQKYEQWLDDLEAKKDQTPAKVFDRVRQDYLARLQTVVEQLQQHTGAMQEHAANLVAQLKELEANEEETNEHLAEAELRAQVGEITATEWESTKRKAERELTKLKEGQLAVAEQLTRIHELLGGSPADDGTDQSPPRTSADFNELEFLKSVVGSNTPATPAPAAPAPVGRPSGDTPKPVDAPKADAPTSDAPNAAEPARASKEVAKTAEPAAPAAKPAEPEPAPKPLGVAVVKEVSGDLTSKQAPPADAPKKTPTQTDSVLGIRTSGAVEQPKTLKCAECGSMNYPSEWYCERCGAELTVI